MGAEASVPEVEGKAGSGKKKKRSGKDDAKGKRSSSFEGGLKSSPALEPRSRSTLKSSLAPRPQTLPYDGFSGPRFDDGPSPKSTVFGGPSPKSTVFGDDFVDDIPLGTGSPQSVKSVGKSSKFAKDKDRSGRGKEKGKKSKMDCCKSEEPLLEPKQSDEQDAGGKGVERGSRAKDKKSSKSKAKQEKPSFWPFNCGFPAGGSNDESGHQRQGCFGEAEDVLPSPKARTGGRRRNKDGGELGLAYQDDLDGAVAEDGEGGPEAFVQVRILAAHNLVNMDSGLFGDLSDPYVVVKIGQSMETTPCIPDCLDPVWDHDNEFTFPVYSKAANLELAVMDKDFLRDTSLGTLEVPLWKLPPNEWQSIREPLENIRHGELSLEARLCFDEDQLAAQGKKGSRPRIYFPFGSQGRAQSGGGGSSGGQGEEASLPMLGVRVLEVTRRLHCAALCGKMLAAAGADVVRINVKNEDSMAELRPCRAASKSSAGSKASKGSKRGKKAPKEDEVERLLLERARASVVPAKYHVGKRVAPHDLGDASDLASLHSDLLPGCDVFITDLPEDELEYFRLNSSALRQRFPTLIVVSTASIGAEADLLHRGVEDTGAFYCLTGLAEQLGHSLGPLRFSAALGTSALLGATAMAVLRRRCGGYGDRVDFSVFRTGRWCSAIGSMTNWAKPPRPDVRYNMGTCNLGKVVAPFDVEGVGYLESVVSSTSPPQMEKSRNLRWKQTSPVAQLPSPQEGSTVSAETPLGRVSVIELSDEYQVSAAAIGTILADFGATVTKLERPQRPDPWKRMCPELYREMNKKKFIQDLNYTSVGCQAALYKTLAETTMLVTNLPMQALDSWGLGILRLRSMFPHLIIVLVTTWGLGGAQPDVDPKLLTAVGTEAHAFWEASGLSERFNNVGMPPGLGEMSVALHALGGLGLALLRQQRTGTGQLVHVSRLQAGSFACQLDPEAIRPPLSSPLLPVQEGRFVRILNRGHQPYDAWLLLQALDLRPSLWEKFDGQVPKMKKYLAGLHSDDLKGMREELVAATRGITLEKLIDKLQAVGIDWYVEEMRPTDVEKLHRERAKKFESLKLEHQEAVEMVLKYAEETAHRDDDCQDLQHELESRMRAAWELERESAQQIQALKEQFMQGVPPEVYVELRTLQGLNQLKWDDDCEVYCVCDIPEKPDWQIKTPTVRQKDGDQVEWHTVRDMVNPYAIGDALSFRLCQQRSGLTLPIQEPLPATPGELSITIKAAYNLKTPPGGDAEAVADPCVMVQLGQQRFTTSAVTDNLNPTWTADNNFRFEVSEADEMIHIEVKNQSSPEGEAGNMGWFDLDLHKLEVEAPQRIKVPLNGAEGAEIEFDCSLRPPIPATLPPKRQDPVLGVATLPSSSFYPNGSSGVVLQFLDDVNHELGVALELSIIVQPRDLRLNPVPATGAPDSPGSPATQPGGGGNPLASIPPTVIMQSQAASVAPTAYSIPPTDFGHQMATTTAGIFGAFQNFVTSHTGKSAASPKQPEKFSPEFGIPGSYVMVRIKQATNLRNTDTGMFGDVSDPYVVAKVGTHEEKTPTLMNNLNPVWDNSNEFIFEVSLDDLTLHLACMNSNRFKDDCLGRLDVDLRMVERNEWCSMNRRLEDGYGGTLEFDIYFKPTTFDALKLDSIGLLEVKVVGATKLKNTDFAALGDISDPYVLVKVGKEERKTPTINNDLNPKWTEGNEFCFPIEDLSSQVEIEVFNSNYQKDDSLGSAVLALHSLEIEATETRSEKLAGGGGGEVQLEVLWKPTPLQKMHLEVLQRKETEKTLAAKAASLKQQVMDAEFSCEWVQVGGSAPMPMSLDEKLWESVAGGLNIVVPAWIAVGQNQLAIREKQRQQYQHRVTLFSP